MKNYLIATINEQIERGRCLKSLIPHPVKYAELCGLSERCKRLIDDHTYFLQNLLLELRKRDDEDVRDILRGLRDCTRNIELVEAFGIPVLYSHNTEEMEYLNKLVFEIYQEINYPLDHPAVACISTTADYYYYSSDTHVIFVPLSEPYFLRHLPDIFHELGHSVLINLGNHQRLNSLNSNCKEIIKVVTEHYKVEITKTMRETCPKDYTYLLRHLHDQWKNYWLEEFLSDLFALYTLGPAYAYSHLHLTTKKSEDIYNFSNVAPQTHPSDDARMKMLCIGLQQLGFDEVTKDITSKWDKMPFVTAAQPPIDYEHAYPERMMIEIAKLFLKGLKESKFPIITPTELSNLNEESVRKTLNTAWKTFWDNPNEYRNWEEKKIKQLKGSFIKTSHI